MKLSRALTLLLTSALSMLVVAPAMAASSSGMYVMQGTRQWVIAGFSVLAVIVALAAYFLSGARQEKVSGLWTTAILFSLVCVLGMGTIWYMTAHRSPDEDTPPNYREMTGQAELQTLMDEQVALAQRTGSAAPVFVPTGVFIQSLEFSSANNVVVSGYVWQRYAKNMSPEVTRGFVMPEGDVIEGAEAYRFQQGDEEVIGWYIQTTLRQRFEYAKYPFDRQDIWLRIWHKDFAKNVVLVPDFKAYPLVNDEWNPLKQLGLERDFVLERLSLERTYFNYHFNSYNANFGINDYIGQDQFPELYFNVGVRRDVMDAFVAYMIPLVILIFMTFGVQLIVTQIAEKMSLYGISTIGLIGYFASLFFIGILAQLDIRRTLNAPGVVYLEYFYFVLYAILLLQTVNAIVFTLSDRFHFVEFGDNLYPKVVFFPITLGFLFVVTAITFF